MTDATDSSARLKRLIELATMLNSTLKLDELLAKIISAATELMGAESSSLLLADPDTEDLTFTVVDGETATQLSDQKVPAGQGIAGWALQHRQAVVVDDPATDSRFYTGVDTASGLATRNLVAIPLLVKDRPIGVIEIINKVGDGGFTDEDVEIGNALTSFAAVALDNASMYARLADAVVTARLSYRL
ncbi:MAG: GAF domain-containing protein [Acidimicrobiia bacterium]